MRDDFSIPTKRQIAARAAYLCSKPDCRRNQIGPGSGQDSVNLGRVAHICAASVGGPRYNANQTSEERKSSNNGIFLCGGCSDLIDKDNGSGFSVEKLQGWKSIHEDWVSQNLNKSPEEAGNFENVLWNESGTVGAQIGSAANVTINFGVSRLDALEIAREVFEKNFQILSGEAFATATERASEISERFVERIRSEGEKLLNSINDPAIQSALYGAQKGYAESGNANLRDILIELVVERCRGQAPDFFSSQISQAIAVTPKLTSEMLHTLSMVAVIRYGIRPNGEAPIAEYLELLVERVFKHANFGDRDCRALAATGCLEVQSGTVNFSTLQFLETFWERNFPELFEGMPDISEEIVRTTIIELCPSVAPVFDNWNRSMLTFSGITKVGAAIGISNLKVAAGINPPLRPIIES